jgi:hypothetical protein
MVQHREKFGFAVESEPRQRVYATAAEHVRFGTRESKALL